MTLEHEGPRAAVRGPKHILISLHGITTTGKWQKDLQECCDAEGIQHRPFDFGWFGIFQFVLPFLRQRKVQWFRDEYQRLVGQEQLGQSPPSIIAHSFGTYIVARAMESFHDVRFRRMIFCGSIVNRDYDWDATIGRGQAERVLNEFGRKDIWVRLAEWVLQDGGSSGYQGFDNIANGAVVQRRHPHWRHSDYFFKLNYERNWIPFLVGKHDPALLQENRSVKVNWRFVIVISCFVILVLASVWQSLGTERLRNWWTAATSNQTPPPVIPVSSTPVVPPEAAESATFLSATRAWLDRSQSDYRAQFDSGWRRSPAQRDILHFPATIAKLTGHLQVEFNGQSVTAIWFTADGKSPSTTGGNNNCDPASWTSAHDDFKNRYGAPSIVTNETLVATAFELNRPTEKRQKVISMQSNKALTEECARTGCKFVPHHTNDPTLLHQLYEFKADDDSKWEAERILLHYSVIFPGDTSRALPLTAAVSP